MNRVELIAFLIYIKIISIFVFLFYNIHFICSLAILLHLYFNVYEVFTLDSHFDMIYSMYVHKLRFFIYSVYKGKGFLTVDDIRKMFSQIAPCIANDCLEAAFR